jgi:hypothetical protein
MIIYKKDFFFKDLYFKRNLYLCLKIVIKMTHYSYLKFIFSLILFFFNLICNAQYKRALLVGISDYDFNRTRWEKINGANDIILLSSDLKNKGFHQIVTLLDKEATCDNIKKKLNDLIYSAQKGDIIYFHYSGHGQPVLDTSGDEGTEDGWDESIIPYDACSFYKKKFYEGEKHISDDQLNEYFMDLRKAVGQTGIVYVVIDACFSGSGLRSLTDEENSTYPNEEIDLEAPIRGNCVEFNFGKDIFFDPKNNFTTYYHIDSPNGVANIIALEACLPHQKCREIKVKDKYYGPLSYYIHESLRTNDITCNNTSWITDAVRLHRSDRRLFRQKIVCESTLDSINGF